MAKPAKKSRTEKLQIKSPRGVAAFAWIRKADTGGEYSDDKYKVTLVMEPGEELDAFQAQIDEFARKVHPTVDPEEIRLPIKDGDESKHEEFHGKFTMLSKTQFKPTCMDAKKKVLPKGVEVRSGDEIRLVVTLSPYTKTEKVKEGKKLVDVKTFGVSASLDMVQLLKKGSGGSAAAAGLLDEEDGFDADEYDVPDRDQEDADEAADDASDDADGDY